MFFDELRPPPARPGQFEEAHWPEEGGGGADGSEGRGRVNAGVADGAFEEVTLPEVDEDGHKMDAAMSRRQRRAKEHTMTMVLKQRMQISFFTFYSVITVCFNEL